MANNSYVNFSYVSKIYRSAKGVFPIVEDFALQIDQGEFVSIIGHSGCGKSTMLMIAAGLSDATTGGFILENREVTDPGPDRAVVFQSPSLLPWMTALENVMLGARQVYPHATRKQRHDLCKYYLTRVGLGKFMEKKAAEMSNGMK